MKTANLAIVFTDIKGFTERTSRQTLEQNQRLLQRHSELLRPLFQAFSGRVIKSIGDAFLATFESPTQAVLCGAAIQDRLWQHNRAAPAEEQLHIRVAINVGEVRLEDKDVFGEPVNIASRVEQIAEAGEVYFTEAVYLAMNKAEVPSAEVGAFELKGIPGKVRVFKVPRAPYRVEAPAEAKSAGPEAGVEQPPFGNLGLSRVEDPPPASLGATAAALGSAAGELGGKLATGTKQVLEHVRQHSPQALAALGSAAGELGGKLAAESKQVLAEVRQRRPRALVLAGAGALVVAAALFFALRGSALDRKIDAVASAPAGERNERIKEIQALMVKEEPPVQAYYEARLDEAVGARLRAINEYARAAEKGERRGERRLIELLQSPECPIRLAAAQTLGGMKSQRARGALEELAREGGPGEDPRFLIGCDSKGAAEQALRALE